MFRELQEYRYGVNVNSHRDIELHVCAKCHVEIALEIPIGINKLFFTDVYYPFRTHEVAVCKSENMLRRLEAGTVRFSNKEDLVNHFQLERQQFQDEQMSQLTKHDL